MSEMQRWHASELLSELRVPWRQQWQARAKLAELARSGEVSVVFRGERIGDEYVIQYVRLREPRSRTPRLVAIWAGALGLPIAVGSMIYHARNVILTGVLSLLLLAAAIATVGAICSAIASSGRGHCPGAWHK